MFCMKQDQLFDAPLALPDGFFYRHEFITPAEETDLIAAIRQGTSLRDHVSYARRVWRGFSRPMGRVSMLGVG